MVTRIDVEVGADATSSRVLIDGVPAGTRRVITAVQSAPTRHGVWIDGVRQFDVEVYLNGRLEAYVGARSPETEQSYEEFGPPPTERAPAYAVPPELQEPPEVDLSAPDPAPLPVRPRRWMADAWAGWPRGLPLPRTSAPR